MSRSIPQVPIEFEFQIRELRSNPSFRIDPSRGVVPAHGSVIVEITFSPTMLRTEEMVIEVGLIVLFIPEASLP